MGKRKRIELTAHMTYLPLLIQIVYFEAFGSAWLNGLHLPLALCPKVMYEVIKMELVWLNLVARKSMVLVELFA